MGLDNTAENLGGSSSATLPVPRAQKEIPVSVDQMLTSKNIGHVYRVSEGGHTWPNWRLYLSEFAPKLFPVSRRIKK